MQRQRSRCPRFCYQECGHRLGAATLRPGPFQWSHQSSPLLPPHPGVSLDQYHANLYLIGRFTSQYLLRGSKEPFEPCYSKCSASQHPLLFFFTFTTNVRHRCTSLTLFKSRSSSPPIPGRRKRRPRSTVAHWRSLWFLRPRWSELYRTYSHCYFYAPASAGDAALAAHRACQLLERPPLVSRLQRAITQIWQPEGDPLSQVHWMTWNPTLEM